MYSKRKPNPRADALIRQLSASVPGQVLADLLNIDLQVLQRQRARLGVRISYGDARRISAAFHRELPDLSECSLVESEIRALKVLRHGRIQARAERGLAQSLDLIAEFGDLVPTAVLARIVDRNHDWVLQKMKEEDLLPSVKDQRRISRDFESAAVPPVPHRTLAHIRQIVTEEWESARERKFDLDRRRNERKVDTAAKKLATMIAVRESLRQGGFPPTETLCTGSCGELWPRKSGFFTASMYAEDGLSSRCLYCDFRATQTRLARGADRPRRTRGKILSEQEEARCWQILDLYGNVVPGELIALLFGVSINTIYRIRLDHLRTLSAQDTARITRAWLNRTENPPLEQLLESERRRLLQFSERWSEEKRKLLSTPRRTPQKIRKAGVPPQIKRDEATI